MQIYFLPQIPPDAEIVRISRAIGQERLVDEMNFRFTHTVPMDWMLPGVAPMGMFAARRSYHEDSKHVFVNIFFTF